MNITTNTTLSESDALTGNLLSSTIALLRSANFDLTCIPAGIPFQVHVFDTWEDAIEFFCKDRNGCLLIDFDENRAEAIDHLRTMVSDWALLTIVACSSSDHGETALTAAKAGCFEFARLPLDRESFLRSVMRACTFDSVGDNSPRLFRSRMMTLTSREFEVLRLFLSGMNTKTISKQLEVSYQTIDKHRNRALKKMCCSSLVDLARSLYQKQSWRT